MVKFILKRIGTMIIAMFMIILITFTLMHSIPGGPFTNTKGVPEEVTQAMEAKYGLDQPMPVQFVKYLGSLLHGDFGPSYNIPAKPSTILLPPVRRYPPSWALSPWCLCCLPPSLWAYWPR